ncbi:hypothetical protein DLM45_14775 [Hyphomicrobium methylovorum]|nr:hypothetical protein [Hyphomicrobium methylovorum]
MVVLVCCPAQKQAGAALRIDFEAASLLAFKAQVSVPAERGKQPYPAGFGPTQTCKLDVRLRYVHADEPLFSSANATDDA